MKTSLRLVLLVLPTAVVATVAACSSPDEIAPFSTVRRERGDQELQRELSWTATTVARCHRGGTGPGCTGSSDGHGTRPANLRPTAGEILPGLPTKDIVCSIARTLLDGAKDFAIGEINGGASDASSGETADAAAAGDASPAGPESADAGTRGGTRPFFFHGGPIDEVDAGGHAVADVVWDLERAEAAVLFHADGGVGGAAAIEGAYDGTATGTSSDLITAWRGPVVNALAADAGATRLVRHLQSSVLSVPQAAAKGPLPLPAPLTPVSAAGYEPWDLATEALAGRLTVARPEIVGEAGRRVLRWSAGGDAAAPSPASAMAVNMMTAAGDRGDFATRAGRAALVAIANGVARAAGLGLDRWCGGDAGGDGGADASAEATTRASCIAEPSRCGAGGGCLWNGPEDGFCCRPHATGETYCTAGDSACGAGEICTQRSDGRFVCAAKETCR